MIGLIGNYYGTLEVKKHNNKFWWSIPNYRDIYWEEIPESLYKELIEFNNSITEEERNKSLNDRGF